MRGILTYHSIDRSGSPISITPDAFRAHVDWLTAATVPVVSLAELLALPAGSNGVALTFDDGLASVAVEAAPLLAVHGLPATVFVVTRHVGRDNRWNRAGDPGIPVQSVLGWAEIARLQAQGFAIGAHTRHHRRLTHCSVGELADELGGAADDIAGALGERPATFAYPYGSVDARVADAAAKEFAIACTTEFRPVGAGTPRALVPRLDAWYFTDAAKLRGWGSAAFARSIAMRHALRRIRRVFR